MCFSSSRIYKGVNFASSLSAAWSCEHYHELNCRHGVYLNHNHHRTIEPRESEGHPTGKRKIVGTPEHTAEYAHQHITMPIIIFTNTYHRTRIMSMNQPTKATTCFEHLVRSRSILLLSRGTSRQNTATKTVQIPSAYTVKNKNQSYCSDTTLIYLPPSRTRERDL